VPCDAGDASTISQATSCEPCGTRSDLPACCLLCLIYGLHAQPPAAFLLAATARRVICASRTRLLGLALAPVTPASARGLRRPLAAPSVTGVRTLAPSRFWQRALIARTLCCSCKFGQWLNTEQHCAPCPTGAGTLSFLCTNSWSHVRLAQSVTATTLLLPPKTTSWPNKTAASCLRCTASLAAASPATAPTLCRVCRSPVAASTAMAAPSCAGAATMDSPSGEASVSVSWKQYASRKLDFSWRV
jgi:hypothetical protein